jgi:uncharacterized integral membrane protein
MFLAITPTLQDDVSLWLVLAAAAVNPAVSTVAYLMGTKADQPAKLIVAAFAASLCGMALIWFATLLRIPGTATLSRAAAGIFVVQVLFGLGWAYAGYKLRQRRPGP